MSAKPLEDILEKEDDAFAQWLVGFIDGEGCFDIHRQHRGAKIYFYCRFTMIQRAGTVRVGIMQPFWDQLRSLRPYSEPRL